MQSIGKVFLIMKQTYLIQNKSGLFKIGKSNNPERRLKELKTGNPDLKIIAFGTGIAEKELHTIFKSKKYKGEFYKLKKYEVEKIIRMLKNEYKPYMEKHYDHVINFGKWKGTDIIKMKSIEQLRYVKWFVKNGNKKQKCYKAFLWWYTYNTCI